MNGGSYAKLEVREVSSLEACLEAGIEESPLISFIDRVNAVLLGSNCKPRHKITQKCVFLGKCATKGINGK